jgi:hypothetical protein
MPLSFPPTPHQCLRAAQLLFCGAAAASTVLLGRPGRTPRGLRLAIPIITFFSAAFTTRFVLQETESRLQMAAFSVAALLLERIRSAAADESFNLVRWGLNSGAAAAGVLLAKHILEPGAISIFGLRILDALRP